MLNKFFLFSFEKLYPFDHNRHFPLILVLHDLHIFFPDFKFQMLKLLFNFCHMILVWFDHFSLLGFEHGVDFNLQIISKIF